MKDEAESYNFFPLIIRFIVTEDRGSFPEILRFAEETVGEKVDSNALFLAVSKLVEYNILKINNDTTGTFSLRDWKSQHSLMVVPSFALKAMMCYFIAGKAREQFVVRHLSSGKQRTALCALQDKPLMRGFDINWRDHSFHEDEFLPTSIDDTNVNGGDFSTSIFSRSRLARSKKRSGEIASQRIIYSWRRCKDSVGASRCYALRVFVVNCVTEKQPGRFSHFLRTCRPAGQSESPGPLFPFEKT